jgi:hypothetical protein
MERETQLVHARAVLTVAATKRGKTIYLKIPNDINTFGIQDRDSVQIAYIGKLYREIDNRTQDVEEANSER